MKKEQVKTINTDSAYKAMMVNKAEKELAETKVLLNLSYSKKDDYSYMMLEEEILELEEKVSIYKSR